MNRDPSRKSPATLSERGILSALGKPVKGLKSRAEDNLRALGLILRATEAAFKDQEAEEFYRDLVAIVLEETFFENVSLMLYNPEENSLDLVAARDIYQHFGGETGEYHADLRFLPGKWIAWQVFESYSPVFLEDTSHNPIPDLPFSKVKPRCLVSLPIGGQGVLNLSCSTPRTLEPYHKRDLIIVANVIGHLLHESRIRNRLSMSHQHLQQLVEAKATELNGSDTELKSSIGYMEYVIQNAPQGICLMDPDGLVHHANASFLSMLDVSEEDLKGFSPETLFKERADYSNLRMSVEQNGFAQAYDVSLVRSDGSVIPADVFLHSIKSVNGQVQGQMLVIHDLSEQKAVTERMVHTEKLRALGTMAGGIAHDFNNLLTTILGNVELLARECRDPAVLRRLRNIETAVNDGAHTVRRLQAFTTFGSRHSREDASCDPNEAITEVIELTKPRWKDEQQKKGATINIKADLSETPLVALHESDLREVLTNLVFNAIDAMPNGGTIRFSTSVDGDRVKILIGDTGCGIDEKVKSRIFDPFFSTKGVGNSGLGLSVSYGIIASAGGSIDVKSQAGRGTTFIIELPVADTTRVMPARVSGTGSETKKLKILVVDDDEQIVDLLCTMLRNQGHQVVGLTSGEQAIRHLDNHVFDLVLTDLGMPEVSGLEIAAEAKRAEHPPAVALLTGWGVEYEREDLKEKGVDAVLPKPFKFSELARLVGTLAGR